MEQLRNKLFSFNKAWLNILLWAALVQANVPNAPELIRMQCFRNSAILHWRPSADRINRDPLLGYSVKFNTSYSPHLWEDAIDYYLPAQDTTFMVPLSPGAKYSFRIVAINKNGPSPPSNPSQHCTNPEDVPHKNPENVEARSIWPDSLVITWTPMPEIEHNGRGFFYRIYHRPAQIEDANYQQVDVYPWTQNSVLITDQPMSQMYRVKVVAHNVLGAANVNAPEIYSSGVELRTQKPKPRTSTQFPFLLRIGCMRQAKALKCWGTFFLYYLFLMILMSLENK